MWLRLAALGLAAAAIAVTGLLGGLDTVAAQPVIATPAPRVLPVGQTVDAGPWTITVTSATAVMNLGSLRPFTDGDRFLAVVVDIKVTDIESRNGAERVVQLSGVDGLRDQSPRHVKLLRDSDDVGYLNPGLPERVAYIWEQVGTSPVPTEVRVELVCASMWYDSLAKVTRWLEGGTCARVTVPVIDRTVADG